MANKNEFRVTEEKSTVQKLVDYNSNTLLPYTILDAITEYTTSEEAENNISAAFGMNLIYKNMLKFISSNQININLATAADRYYPVFYDKVSHDERNYTDGLIRGTQAFSFRNPNGTSEESEFKFLSQDGTFQLAPIYEFSTAYNNTARADGIALKFYPDDTPGTKKRTLVFSYDQAHFTHLYNNTSNNGVFGPNGSLLNFLDAVDDLQRVTYGDSSEETASYQINSDGKGRYIPLFHRPDPDTANQGSDKPTKCILLDAFDVTMGFCRNINAGNSPARLNSNEQDANSIDSSHNIIGKDSDSYSYIVYQKGPRDTRFLQIPESTSFGNGEGNANNGNICLVTDNSGVLRWGSAGIQMNAVNDNTEHYLLGKSTDEQVSTRADSIAFSTQTYFKNGSIFQYSDERLKSFKETNITLKDITSIKVSKFSWKDSDDVHFGVSAQSVEKVLPEIVTTSSKGYKSVEYDKLGALSIYGIQLLVNEIEELKSRIENLENKLNN